MVGQQPDPDAASPATGIIRVTRHPFMWGVALWALLHLAANGDEASVIFFGSIAVLALVGTVLIDARRTRENAPGWGVFLQATSNLPFAAILERRQQLRPARSACGGWRWRSASTSPCSGSTRGCSASARWDRGVASGPGRSTIQCHSRPSGLT